MRFAIALVFMATLASAQTHPAWRLVPYGQAEYNSDGGGMNGDWTIASGPRLGLGGQATLYVPKEDSMGWAVVLEANGGMFTGDMEGTLKVPDGSASGFTLNQSFYDARIQSGPFYRLFGMWGTSGGVFGYNWNTSASELAWSKEDYALFFGVYSEFGSDPWSRNGARLGVSAGRLGGSETWTAIYPGKATSDSLEWLREGYRAEAKVEYWHGPIWAQLVAGTSSLDLRHRSEEGSTGSSTEWNVGLRLGYRFAMGDLKGFR